MVSPQLATSMRMALPPQLAHLLGDLAPTVSEYSELAPGIPASKEVFEDMFHMLKHRCFRSEPTNVTDFHVRVSITRNFKKQDVTSLLAAVECYSGVNDAGPVSNRYELGMTTACKEFPFTFAGTRAAIHFLAEEKNYAKRRGFCSDCLAQETPKKRLRIAGTKVCGVCVLTKA